jgi:hypothetical protein
MKNDIRTTATQRHGHLGKTAGWATAYFRRSATALMRGNILTRASPPGRGISPQQQRNGALLCGTAAPETILLNICIAAWRGNLKRRSIETAERQTLFFFFFFLQGEEDSWGLALAFCAQRYRHSFY